MKIAAKLAVSTFAACIAFTSAANAEDNKLRSMFQTFFEGQDEDGDAKLNADEMYQMGRNVFVSMDADSDRVVTKEEFLTWDIGTQDLAAELGRSEALGVAMEVFFSRLDQNNDKKFNTGEWRRLHTLGSARADANGDDIITFDEFWDGFPIASAIRVGMGDS